MHQPLARHQRLRIAHGLAAACCLLPAACCLLPRCRQVFNVPGRCFPVDVIHSQDDHMQDYAAAAIDTALQIHMQQPAGRPWCRLLLAPAVLPGICCT